MAARLASLVVHYLEYGRPLCGRPGLPYQWPPDERFVTLHDRPENLVAVNCPGCKAVLATRAEEVAGYGHGV